MDPIIISSFDAMESTLNELVDSMTSYNPSTDALGSLQTTNALFTTAISKSTSLASTPSLPPVLYIFKHTSLTIPEKSPPTNSATRTSSASAPAPRSWTNRSARRCVR
jgi:hypothetical protein